MAQNTSLSASDQAAIDQANQQQSQFFGGIGQYGGNLLNALMGKSEQGMGSPQSQQAPVQQAPVQQAQSNSQLLGSILPQNQQGPMAPTMSQGVSQQNPIQTPADQIAADEAEKSYRDALGDHYDSMPLQVLGRLVNMNAQGAITGPSQGAQSILNQGTSPTMPSTSPTMAPASTNPLTSMLPSQSNTQAPSVTPQNQGISQPTVGQNLWRNTLGVNQQTGQPGAFWQLLNEYMGKGYIQPAESPAELVLKQQEISGTKKVQPIEQATIQAGINTARLTGMNDAMTRLQNIRTGLTDEFKSEDDTRSQWDKLSGNLTDRQKEIKTSLKGLDTDQADLQNAFNNYKPGDSSSIQSLVDKVKVINSKYNSPASQSSDTLTQMIAEARKRKLL